jgi:histidinol phosphatase-like enzyme (inositol monophosphatase family)
MTNTTGARGSIELAGLDDTVGPLVRRAGEIAMREFRASPAVEDKGGGAGGFDPVTEADRMTERYLRRALSALFPVAQIVGEEGGTTGAAGPVQWVIDPIDGTRAYITGVPLWGVLLGLVIDGRPVAGWCRQPYLDETFAAVSGRAWLDHAGSRRNLDTRPTTDLADASMYSTHPSMFASPWERAAFEALAARVRLQRFGGDCYSYCLLALGAIDLVVEANLQPYDIVPLIPIVDAAGGVVSGLQGQVPLEGGFVVAAATPELHAQALDSLRAIPAP